MSDMNNPLNKAASAADKAAKLQAELDEKRRKEQEAADKKAREKKAKEVAEKAAVERFEQEIRRLLNTCEASGYWSERASKLLKELGESSVSGRVSQSLRRELSSKIGIVENKLMKMRRKRQAREKVLKVLGILAIVLVGLAVNAFSIYSWASGGNPALFKVAFGAEITIAIVGIILAKTCFSGYYQKAQRTVCIIIVVVSILLAIAMCFSGGLKNREFMHDGEGVMYEVVDGEYYLYDCDKGVKELVLSTLSEQVVGVSEKAFKGNKTITSITFDVSNLIIKKGAFQNCTALTKVEFIGGDATISSTVFKGCKKLQSVVFDGGSYTFNGCSNLFAGCNALKDIYFNGGNYMKKGMTRILGGLDKIAVHHKNADIDIPLKGAKELTLVVYPGTDSIYSIKPDVLVFAEGFDFSGDFGAERGSFDNKPYAPVTYFPASVTYIPDILGSNRRKYDVYYQGTSGDWSCLSIAGDGGFFDIANMNYKHDLIRMHYNSNCRFWGND